MIPTYWMHNSPPLAVVVKSLVAMTFSTPFWSLNTTTTTTTTMTMTMMTMTMTMTMTTFHSSTSRRPPLPRSR